MRVSPATRILIGLGVGAAAGVAGNAFGGGARLEWVVAHLTEPAGKIFLRLLLMLVVPIVFPALAVGVADMEMRRFGRVGLKTLLYTLLLSAIAVAVGVALVNLVRPGEHVSETVRAALARVSAASGAAPPSGVDLVVGLVPDNVIRAMADGNLLAVMLFAVLFGVGLALVRTEATAAVRRVLDGVFEVSMRLLGLVIALAPIGVAALVFTTTARLGAGLLRGLAAYVLVVVAALAVHQFAVYSVVVRVLGGMGPLTFFRAVRLAMVTAFSTASSNATLPTAIQVADRELGLPRAVSRFVLTIGATMNQNGTALFEGVTVLFLAQLYGVPLAVGQQVIVVFLCILGGIGTAGVPGGSLPVVMMILASVGVPPESIGLVLGVDRFLDMCRTTLNVTGDLAAAVVIARSECETPAEAVEPRR